MNPTSLKARQAQKIAQIGEALRAAGVLHLDQQAAALGLSRSTTYTVITARHKASGISAKILAEMLRSARLPWPVREVIKDYAREKASGAFGNNKQQQRRFCAALHQREICIHD